VGGEEGKTLLAQTDAWMHEHGVVNPDALTAMVAPGYGGAVNAGGRASVERERT
jgi:hypothetical protein